ncbi:MAG: hypothetical protein OER95_07560 [Acidimicrobiia bacterium]|nr:hypothetical protein [Acidimicrobiia bacterium]
MAFHVIFVTPGLNDQDEAEAVAAGPPYVSAQTSYPDLLDLAGFDEIDEEDVTDQYRATAAAWLVESARAREELVKIVGMEEFRRGQNEREESVAAIEAGLLRRALFAARAG